MDKPEPPEPPRPIPPAPPPAAMLRKDAATHVPLTPMMDFLSRRLESLERELIVERERASAAQGMLQQQEALRGQVESQLKLMSESLRREKTEKDSEESKQHARGRIDSLEKRLDDMHQSWVTLLREAVSQRESSHTAVTTNQDVIAREQAGLKQEILALHGAIETLSQQMGQWRAETKPIADAAPSLQAFEGKVSQMMDHFAAELRDRVSAWERRQMQELEKQEERLQSFAREKSSLIRELEERDHLLRSESIKEKLHRERMLGEQFSELAKRLDELKQEASAGRDKLAFLHDKAQATPLARDKTIEVLEAEKMELVRALKDRSDALKQHLAAKREVESTLGQSLLQAHQEAEQARARAEELALKLMRLEQEQLRHDDELEAAKRSAQEREARRQALEAERDEIGKTLMLEADKSRQSHEIWTSHMSDLQSKLTAAIDAKTSAEVTAVETRGQMATLSEHLARALQELDSYKKDGGWDKERTDLIRRLEEKEQMIAMLNSTFRKFLK